MAARRAVSSDNVAAWDAYSATYQAGVGVATTAAQYGPDLPGEDQLRLLGNLEGKRVLDLGCGGGQAAIAFARAKAAVIGVDSSAAQLAVARRLCAAEEVRLELRQGDLADLAFLRADSIDVAFSARAFGYVEDLGRVFRQVHRVLKVGAPLVFSVVHPVWHTLDAALGSVPVAPVSLRRSYFDRTPRVHPVGDRTLVEYPHRFADLYQGLVRASYRVDLVLEPPRLASDEQDAPGSGSPLSAAERPGRSGPGSGAHLLPSTLIVRARKEGS